MKRLLFLTCFLLTFVGNVHAALVTFALTNFDQTLATNDLIISPVSSPLVNGSYNVIGLPRRIHTTNGLSSLTLTVGAYEMKIVGMTLRSNILFAVPNNTGTYTSIELGIPGGNFFNYTGMPITNLNGGFIQNGTINSNAFDANTLGVLGATNTVSGSNILVTHASGLNTVALATNVAVGGYLNIRSNIFTRGSTNSLNYWGNEGLRVGDGSAVFNGIYNSSTNWWIDNGGELQVSDGIRITDPAGGADQLLVGFSAGLVFKGTGTGNGSGFTNLNGANIQTSTIVSNALDLNTIKALTNLLEVTAGANITVTKSTFGTGTIALASSPSFNGVLVTNIGGTNLIAGTINSNAFDANTFLVLTNMDGRLLQVGTVNSNALNTLTLGLLTNLLEVTAGTNLTLSKNQGTGTFSLVAAPSFNGLSITNINGTNIQASTINSNAMDAGTLALLGGSSTAAGTNLTKVGTTISLVNTAAFNGLNITNLNGTNLQNFTVRSNVIDAATWALATNVPTFITNYATTNTYVSNAYGLRYVGELDGVVPVAFFTLNNTNTIFITGAGTVGINGQYNWAYNFDRGSGDAGPFFIKSTPPVRYLFYDNLDVGTFDIGTDTNTVDNTTVIYASQGSDPNNPIGFYDNQGGNLGGIGTPFAGFQSNTLHQAHVYRATNSDIAINAGTGTNALVTLVQDIPTRNIFGSKAPPIMFVLVDTGGFQPTDGNSFTNVINTVRQSGWYFIKEIDIDGDTWATNTGSIYITNGNAATFAHANDMKLAVVTTLGQKPGIAGNSTDPSSYAVFDTAFRNWISNGIDEIKLDSSFISPTFSGANGFHSEDARVAFESMKHSAYTNAAALGKTVEVSAKFNPQNTYKFQPWLTDFSHWDNGFQNFNQTWTNFVHSISDRSVGANYFGDGHFPYYTELDFFGGDTNYLRGALSMLSVIPMRFGLLATNFQTALVNGIMTNQFWIRAHQDSLGIAGQMVYSNTVNGTNNQIWVRQLSQGQKQVVFYNPTNRGPAVATVTWQMLGWPSNLVANAQSFWWGTNGNVTGQMTVTCGTNTAEGYILTPSQTFFGPTAFFGGITNGTVGANKTVGTDGGSNEVALTLSGGLSQSGTTLTSTNATITAGANITVTSNAVGGQMTFTIAGQSGAQPTFNANQFSTSALGTNLIAGVLVTNEQAMGTFGVSNGLFRTAFFGTNTSVLGTNDGFMITNCTAPSLSALNYSGQSLVMNPNATARNSIANNAGYSAIFGGANRIGTDSAYSIMSGWGNVISNASPFSVALGYANVVSFNNGSSGFPSFAFGTGARALHHSAFVWNGIDNSNGSVVYDSHDADTFNVQAPGGIWLEARGVTPADGVTLSKLHLNAAGGIVANGPLIWTNALTGFNNTDQTNIITFDDTGFASSNANGKTTVFGSVIGTKTITVSNGVAWKYGGAALVTLTNVVVTNVVIDFPQCAAKSSTNVLVVVQNLKSNDFAFVSAPAASMPAHGLFNAWVSNTDLYIRYNNITENTVDPGSGTFGIKVEQWAR